MRIGEDPMMLESKPLTGRSRLRNEGKQDQEEEKI